MLYYNLKYGKYETYFNDFKNAKYINIKDISVEIVVVKKIYKL